MTKAEDWKNTVTITQKEYDYLNDRDWKLICLEGAGVDNWEGYDFAMEQYNTDEEENED